VLKIAKNTSAEYLYQENICNQPYYSGTNLGVSDAGD